MSYDNPKVKNRINLWIIVMEDARIFKTQYHFVFVTKYRYKVLKGDVGLKVRELIRQTCEAFEI